MASTRLPARTPVIAGLGITEMGRIYGKSAARFAADAIHLAADDAGIDVQSIDGLLTSAGITRAIGLGLARDLGLRDLRMQSEIQSFGATAGAMVQYAAMAVASGMVDTVACVFADAPLHEGVSTGAAYADRELVGFDGLRALAGVGSAATSYAMAARRHMTTYGTTSEQFGAVAVAARKWSKNNPRAQFREEISIDDHQASRWIAEPFHLLDCCLVSNGSVAVIVTSEERAGHLRQPAVHLLGWAQTHPGYPEARGSEWGLTSGAARSGPAAMSMAGITLDDVDVAEIYDCFTFTTMITLEDYGFCKKGEGGDFVASGALEPGARIAVNTGGGELSSYYMWGMTPLSEAIIQARGTAGDRQVDKHDVVLVSGNGGTLDHHSTLVLSKHAAA